MAELTTKTLMDRMPKAFRPEAAEGVDTVLQYHLTGEDGGDWYAVIKDGTCTVHEGVHPDPSMTLTADAEDYKSIFTGETNAMQAFMAGKLKLAGDLNMAMKMPQFFKMS